MPSLLWHARFFAVAALVVISAACSDDGTTSISGCEVKREYPSRGWRGDPFDLHPFFTSVFYDNFKTPACPVPILQVEEPMFAVGVVWSKQVFDPHTGQLNNTERVSLRIYNAAGTVVGEDVQPFFADNIDEKEVEVTTNYDAVTAHRTFTEKDLMQVRIQDYCCTLPQLSGEVELAINYKKDGPNASVSVTGNGVPLRNTSATYGALSLSAGRPHKYRWYLNGALVDSARTYTAAVGSSDFQLRVDMVDAYGRTASGHLTVDVDGIAVQLDGPQRVFAWDPATWTAWVRGGYTPHDVRWYKNGQYVGSGTSYSTDNPGTFDFNLRADVTDGHGTFASQSIFVDVESDCSTTAC